MVNAMTRTAKSQRRPDERPGEIISAALELFSQRGFSATRLDDVAARAGLSKAAIYLYFQDKSALLRAVVVETAGSNVETAAAMIENHNGPVAPMLLRFLTFMSGRLAHTAIPDLIKLVISESRAHPEIGKLYLDTVIGRALPLLQSLIERGIASGEFRPVDAKLAVKSLVGPMVLAAVWRSVLEPLGADNLDIEALARQHGDIIVRGLLAHPSLQATP